MSQYTFKSHEGYTPNSLWKAPVRVLHWLIAISLSGATYLTTQGEPGHATLGWIALGGLMILLLGSRNSYAPGHVLWPVTGGIVALNLSDLLAAQSTFHLGVTLVALAMAAFYFATVLFELLQRVTTSAAGRTASVPRPQRRPG
jgi:cytochrome b